MSLFCPFLLKTLNPFSLSKLKPFCDYVTMPNWECITSQPIGTCLEPHLWDKVLIKAGLKDPITSIDILLYAIYIDLRMHILTF